MRPKRRDLLKMMGAGSLAALSGTMSNTYARSLRQNDSRPPNIILVLVDDLGWSDISTNNPNNEFVNTPNLEFMAKNGTEFKAAYAAVPVCSPTRASILSGRYPARDGITTWIRSSTDIHLDPNQMNVARALKTAGYTTAYTGKWHVGWDEEYWPDKAGFDHCLGVREMKNKNKNAGELDLDYKFRELSEFMESHTDEPFFYELALQAIHNGDNSSSAERTQKYMDLLQGTVPEEMSIEEAAGYYATLEHIDENMGKLIQKTEELGIDNNTIIVYFSDNGANMRIDGTKYAGIKHGSEENGVRVPLIFYGAGIPAGNQIQEMACSIDLYPTFCSFAGIDVPNKEDIDGLSLKPLIDGELEMLPREYLFFSMETDKYHSTDKLTVVVRGRKWKGRAKINKLAELFNMNDDIKEENNLVDEHPDIANQLYAAAYHWRSDIGVNPGEEPDPVALNRHRVRANNFHRHSAKKSYLLNGRRTDGHMKKRRFPHLRVIRD